MAEWRFRQVKYSLPTRYIGPFPDHLHDIIAVVRSARREITILADCVDYGSFRALDLSKALVEELCARREQPRTVRFLIWGRWQTMSRANKYRDAKLRMQPWFRVRVLRFLRSVKKYEPTVSREFYDQIRACRKEARDREANLATPSALSAVQGILHLWFLKNKLNRAGIFPTEHYLEGTSREERVANVLRIIHRVQDEGGSEPSAAEIASEIGKQEHEDVSDPEIFFWIADDREAAFLLPRHGQDALAFRTTDYRLIKALRAMFDEKMKEADLHASDPSNVPPSIRAALRGAS
jgi:hypothetical protein